AEQFDQGWLRAAGQLQQQVRDAANAVLADDGASPEAKAAAQEALRRLDALTGQLEQAADSAGASAPSSVDAGSGGPAAGGGTPVAGRLGRPGAPLRPGAPWRRGRSALSP